MTEAPLAEPGQRLLARIVDTLIVGVPAIAVVRALVSGPTVDVVAPPALAGCVLLYEAIQLALWGRTIGKRVAGIEVVVAVPGAPLFGGTAVKARHGETGALAAEDALAPRETDAETGSEPFAEPALGFALGSAGAVGGTDAEAYTETAMDAGAETIHRTPTSPTAKTESTQNPEAFPPPSSSPEDAPGTALERMQGDPAAAGWSSEAGQPISGSAPGSMFGDGLEQTQEAEPEPVLDTDLLQGQEAEAGPAPDGRTDRVPIAERDRLGVVRAVVRAAVYSLPIAARPIPVAGLLAGIFWLVNAGALYEGTRREALHDRLTGTLVVKRAPTDSSGF
ncbi:RDD family protein [Spirillospora sp. NBC_00431]